MQGGSEYALVFHLCQSLWLGAVLNLHFRPALTGDLSSRFNAWASPIDDFESHSTPFYDMSIRS